MIGVRNLGTALLATAVLVTAACGGPADSNRPSVTQISRALRAGGDGSLVPTSVTLTTKAADCVARALAYSKVSDRALKALVDRDKTFQPSAADEAALKSLDQQLISCVTGS